MALVARYCFFYGRGKGIEMARGSSNGILSWCLTAASAVFVTVCVVHVIGAHTSSTTVGGSYGVATHTTTPVSHFHPHAHTPGVDRQGHSPAAGTFTTTPTSESSREDVGSPTLNTQPVTPTSTATTTTTTPAPVTTTTVPPITILLPPGGDDGGDHGGRGDD